MRARDASLRTTLPGCHVVKTSLKTPRPKKVGFFSVRTEHMPTFVPSYERRIPCNSSLSLPDHRSTRGRVAAHQNTGPDHGPNRGPNRGQLVELRPPEQRSPQRMPTTLQTPCPDPAKRQGCNRGPLSQSQGSNPVRPASNQASHSASRRSAHRSTKTLISIPTNDLPYRPNPTGEFQVRRSPRKTQPCS